MNPRALIALLPAVLPAVASAATIQLSNGDFATGTNPTATDWVQANGAGTNSAPSNYAELIAGLSSRSMQIKSDGGSRQRKIIEALDITRNQAAAQLDEGAEMEAATVTNKVDAKARSIRP